MCKYCENNIDIWKSSKSGYYTIANSIQIKGTKMVVNTSLNRRTAADEYYESWGIDSDGESKYSTKTFAIKFCPFCGKKLKLSYIPQIFIYFMDKDNDNNFVNNIQWLVEEFNTDRKNSYDTSGNGYYLTKKVLKIISKKIKANKNSIAIKDTLYLPNGYDEKPSAIEFREIKEFLNSGNDIFVRIDTKYKNKDYVLDKLKKLKHELIIFDVSNIRILEEKQELDIPIVIEALNSNQNTK